jgi:UTP--glucose-1-phosphate uridylyltransferase
VIPAAGLGTRLGVLSNITPKELLPLVDKPSLQWILDEASEAGLTDICLIISPAKNDLMQKFLAAYPTDLQIHLIIQRRPGGLGHAVLAAERWVGDDPFALILPDDFLLGENPLERLLESHKMTGLSTLALAPASQIDLTKYGVADVKSRNDGLLHVMGIVEKPKLGSSPSNLSVVGRYILTSDIWEPLHQEAINASGEIQLTSALQSLSQEARVVAVEMSGERHDLGNQRGWLAANIAFSDWVEDGSSVLASNNHQKFNEFLAGTMTIAQTSADWDSFVENAIAQKKLIESHAKNTSISMKKPPFITTQMWDTAYMDLIEIGLVQLPSHDAKNENLRSQWRRHKDNPNSVSPYIVLYEEQDGYSVIDGIARIYEMQKLGMSQIPAWVIKNSNQDHDVSQV